VSLVFLEEAHILSDSSQRVESGRKLGLPMHGSYGLNDALNELVGGRAAIFFCARQWTRPGEARAGYAKR
jgi:hypothetical protein